MQQPVGQGCQNPQMMICLVSWHAPITLSFLHTQPRYLVIIFFCFFFLIKSFHWWCEFFEALFTLIWYVGWINWVLCEQEIMYKKLIYAINEGQGSFDLSWVFGTNHNLCILLTCNTWGANGSWSSAIVLVVKRCLLLAVAAVIGGEQFSFYFSSWSCTFIF